MKHYFLIALTMLAVACGEKQDSNNTQQDSTQTNTPQTNVNVPEDRSKRVSPPDSVAATVNGATVSIVYSQPSVRGRKVWGELVAYNEVWRTGANEASVFSTDKDLLIAGKTLSAGKYAFFTIPKEDGNWTLIFNKDFGQWGAFDYKESMDELRVPAIRASMDNAHTEMLKFNVEPNGTVTLNWEKMKLSFVVQTK